MKNMKQFWDAFEKGMNEIFFWIIVVSVIGGALSIIVQFIVYGTIVHQCCTD